MLWGGAAKGLFAITGRHMIPQGHSPMSKPPPPPAPGLSPCHRLRLSLLLLIPSLAYVASDILTFPVLGPVVRRQPSVSQMNKAHLNPPNYCCQGRSATF